MYETQLCVSNTFEYWLIYVEIVELNFKWDNTVNHTLLIYASINYAILIYTYNIWYHDFAFSNFMKI